MKMKKFGNTEARIFDMAKPIAESLGLMIWDIRFEKEGVSWYLRVFINKSGGINIDDCEALSRPLNKLLDETDPIPQSYIFEVGSPGIECELLRQEHFDAFIGKSVKVFFIRPENDLKEISGTLISCDKEKIVISADSSDYEFMLSNVAKVKSSEI